MKPSNILSSPVTLNSGVVIKNRFVKAATSEQLGDNNHNPKPALATAYARWAKGETSISISGNIMVDRTALGEPANVVLDDDSDLDAFKHWAASATQNGMHLWAQLNHPGKQSPKVLCPTPVAPSAIPLEIDMKGVFNQPRALKEEEIWALIDKFSHAADLAKSVGFTGVQIHSAHGYLISQFLSPKHNQRTDQWGGSLKNRMRFVLEVYKAIRQKVGDNFPVAVKLNAGDFISGGFTEEESLQVAHSLCDAGVDLIEISGGTYESQAMVDPKEAPIKPSTQKREAYFLHFAEALKETLTIPLIVTGGFRTTQGMLDAINTQATDFIGLARPLMLYPDLPIKAMNNDTATFEITRPTTGVIKIDKAMMVDLAWWEEQVHLMGRGKEPKVNFSPWLAVWRNFLRIGTSAFKQRRA